jgi:hypothetical protein
MEVDLTTGHFASMRANQIPGGLEFPNFNGSRSAALAQAGGDAAAGDQRQSAAYQRLTISSGCSVTSDLVRGFAITRGS